MNFFKIRGVCDHIMCIRNIVAQRIALKVTMFDYFQVHYILCTLPHQYVLFKIFYNINKN